MPVVVQCFHCNAILELDDGFRGGVCRCGTCGSLLQVPKGDADGLPRGKRVRPAIPPGPSAPTSPSGVAPSDNSTTSISSGAFDPRRGDPGISSGLARIHKTRPIAMPATPPRPRKAPPPPKKWDPQATKKARSQWIVFALISLLIAGILAAMIGVYLNMN